MAGVKISGLPPVPSAQFTDTFPVVQGGVTSKETLSQVATLFGFDATTRILSLSKGGTNAALTASLGGIFYSTATAAGILSGTATANQVLLSGAAAAPTWSTATYPVTTTVNQLLYSSATNVITGLATVTNAVLSTSAGGVPVLSTVLPGGLTTTDPVVAQGLATKNYVDQTALNGTSVYAASAATLGTVTQSGAGVGATLTNAGAQATFALDGVNPPVGSNVLIKNTATGMTSANEGIYTVTNVGSGATNWVLTRATSYDTPTEINNTGLIIVQNGSTLTGTAWYNTSTIVTVDTTAFSYSQFGASNAFTRVNVQTFPSSGTYTPTPGMKYCLTQLVGGGGGGGGIPATTSGVTGACAIGGAGGGYTQKVFTAATIGASQAVTIGAAGAGGAAGNNNGTAGGTTTFGALLSATGGAQGLGQGAVSTPWNSAGSSNAGGLGSSGDYNAQGSSGQGFIVGGACISYGGSSEFGDGASTPIGFNAGVNAISFGSGGSGAISNVGATGGGALAGGNGAPGFLMITEYI